MTNEEATIADPLIYSEKFKNYEKLHSEFAIENSLSEDALTQQYHKHNLTGETLFGKDKIGYRSSTLFFINAETAYSTTFFHLGSKLSGHNRIVHGGLIATLHDELTCLLAFETLPSKTGVTASLTVNYKKPTYVDSYVLIKCEISKTEGRKRFVTGKTYLVDLSSPNPIEHEDNLLSQSEVLVIEPKWAADLHSSNQTS